MKLFCCWYAVVEPWTVLAWLLVEGLLNPAVFGLADCVPLAMCKPAIDPYPGGIMPSSGVVVLLRD